MNNCMHIIDVKETGTKLVTYCTLCGTIFSVKEAQEYNVRDSYLTSGTYTGSPYLPKPDGTKEWRIMFTKEKLEKWIGDLHFCIGYFLLENPKKIHDINDRIDGLIELGKKLEQLHTSITSDGSI